MKKKKIKHSIQGRLVGPNAKPLSVPADSTMPPVKAQKKKLA